MHPRYPFAPRRAALGVLAAALLLFAFAGSAFAQALNTPSLKLNRAGFFRIDLDVTAGASGAPNGFEIQWMKKSDYIANGGWPADEYDPRATVCEFTGTPTLNTDARSSNYALAPNATIEVQMGDLFDETGLYGDYLDALPPGDYAFRVWAVGTGAPGSGSVPSLTFFSSTTVPECTQGFWKNHPEAWPVGCTPMLLGTVAYTQAQLLSIYFQPAVGNGLVSLAHQLITAKLNICNGSDPTNIAATIAAADALIGPLVVPPVGAGFLPPASTSALTQTLDDWNNGLIPGVVSCATKTSQSTWGRVKSMYR